MNGGRVGRDLAWSGVLFMALMLFLPLFERYAYNLLYASIYAMAVAFYAALATDHKVSPSLIFLLRGVSFAYVIHLMLRYNPGFAIIGFLMIYQVTRILEGSFFGNPQMTFLVNLIILYLSLPNHSGTWIMLYFTAFIALSGYFLAAASPAARAAWEAQDVGSREAANGWRAGALRRFLFYYTLRVAAAAAIFFVLIPRFHFNFFTPFYMRFAGMASTFTFNSLDNIRESSSIIMRITKDQEAGTHYRMKSYNRYWLARREWIATTFGSRMMRPGPDGAYELAKTTAELSVAPGKIVNTTFFVRQNPEGFVPNLYFPMSISMSSRSMYNDFMENMYSTEGETTINVRSFVIDPTEEMLRNASGGSPARVISYYQMYPNNFPRIRDLAYTVTKGHRTRYDKVIAIERYLKDNFKYTLAVGDLYGDYRTSEYDPNEVFLFVVKAGHCEFFASAMTLMCQSVGIPARLVRGFVSPEYNENGNYFLVRGTDAHAWVEVYFPQIGFVTFDPTAASAENARGRSGVFAFIGKYIDTLNFFIENYVSYYSNEFFIRWAANALAWLRDAAKALYGAFASPAGGPSGDAEPPLWMRIIGYRRALLALLAIAAWALARKAIRPRLFSLLSRFLDGGTSLAIADILTGHSGRGTGFYPRFAVLAEKRGVAKEPGETPDEFRLRLEKFSGLDRAGVDAVRRITKACYLVECAGIAMPPETARAIEADLLALETASWGVSTK